MKSNRVSLLHSRLGRRMLLVVLIAFVLSTLCFNILIGLTQDRQYDLSAAQALYGEETIRDLVADLQRYVDQNHLTAADSPRLTLWATEHHGISLSCGYDSDPASPYQITFSDKAVAVYPYVETDHYNNMAGVGAFTASMLLFLLIVLPYTHRLLKGVAHLSNEMDIIAAGDLEHEVTIHGKDELSDLARNIEAMRCSFKAQLQSQTDSTEESRRLIAALSHDLRTPLTKEMSYLELLTAPQEKTPEQQSLYLSRAYRAACQVKERSDQLFEYLSLQTAQSDDKPPVLEGLPVFTHLLEEMTSYLAENGFEAVCEPPRKPFALCMEEAALDRVFDNITSNLLKYAAKEKPIQIACEQQDGHTMALMIRNEMVVTDQQADSHGIGLPVIDELMRRQGGRMTYETRDGVFEMRVAFVVS